jgi:beta-lactamase regulating signal transducer with metallopeptidase domain
MNNINNIWHHPAFLALGDMLLHSIWQIGLIGLFVFLILTFQRQLKPETKVNLIYGSMLTSFFLSVYTFIHHYWIYSSATFTAFDNGNTGGAWLAKFQQMSSSEGLWSAQWLSLDWMKVLTLFWIIGICIGLSKFLAGMGGIYQFRKLQSVDVESELYACFRRVSAILPINKEIKLKWSPSARAPFTFGFWSPVIVVPLSFMSGYNIDQIESILAHEMAHIKRKDYLHNIIQYLIETLFFYHPVMWFMVKEMKTQREYACDEWVVRSGWNPFQYAVSLTKIQGHFLVAEGQLTMNSRNAFLDFKRRIQRIVLKKEPTPSFKTQFLTGFATLASFVIMMMYVHLSPVPETQVCLNTEMDEATLAKEINIIDRQKAQLHSFQPKSEDQKKGHICFSFSSGDIRCFDLTKEDLCMQYSENEKRWYLNQNGYVFQETDQISPEPTVTNVSKPLTNHKNVAIASLETEVEQEYTDEMKLASVGESILKPTKKLCTKSIDVVEVLPELPERMVIQRAIADLSTNKELIKEERLNMRGSLVPMTHKRTGTSATAAPEAWTKWVDSEWAASIQTMTNKAENIIISPQAGSNFSLESQLDKESGVLIITLKINKPGIFGLRIMSQENVLIKDWSARYLETGEEQIVIDLSGQKHKSIMVQASCDTPAEKEERMLILNFSNVAVKVKANTWIPEEELYNSMPVPETYNGHNTIVDDIERMLNNKTLVVATYHVKDDWVSYTQSSRKLIKASDCMAGIWNISIPEAFKVNALLTQLKAG